jgi:lipopolysaccharide transport system ATP-binding protein
MKDVSQGQGRTVLFVSHNMASIRALCNHGVLLENGMVKMIGNVNSVVDSYLKDNNGSASSSEVEWTIENAPHKGAVTVLRCAVRCENDIITNETPFDIEFEFLNDEEGFSLGVNPHVFNEQDICLFNVGIGEKPLPKGRYRATFHVPGGLFCEGSYRVDNLYFSHNRSFFNHEHALTFAIHSVREDDFSNYRGVIYPTSVIGQLQTL